MTDYTLKKIDSKFWREVKILAAKRETTIKQLIIDLLKKAVKREKAFIPP